jgi:hypothetical protein
MHERICLISAAVDGVRVCQARAMQTPASTTPPSAHSSSRDHIPRLAQFCVARKSDAMIELEVILLY